MATVVVGVISFFSECTLWHTAGGHVSSETIVLVDFPHTATFLTPEERAWVVHRKSMSPSELRYVDLESEVFVEYDNSSVGEEEHFELRHIWETLLDWQVWAHILIYMSIITPCESSLGPISLFERSLTAYIPAQCTASLCSSRKQPFCAPSRCWLTEPSAIQVDYQWVRLSSTKTTALEHSPSH